MRKNQLARDRYFSSKKSKGCIYTTDKAQYELNYFLKTFEQKEIPLRTGLGKKTLIDNSPIKPQSVGIYK